MKRTVKFMVVLMLVFTILSTQLSVIAVELIAQNTTTNQNDQETMETENATDGKDKIQSTTGINTEETKQKLQEEINMNDSNSEKTMLTEENPSLTGDENQDITQENQQKVQENEIAEEQTNLGKLELEVILRLPTENNFTVSLEKDSKKQTATPINQNDKIYYSFDDLEQGTYVLKIEGQNYINYVQEVEIKNDTTKIVLSNSHDINDKIKGTVKYGVIGLGDIDLDGMITEKDEDQMIQKIESKTYDAKYDLNKDNKIDIIDLSYITYNKEKNINATPLKMLKLADENIELGDGTVITQGQKDTVLKNSNDFVQLKPVNNQNISQDNPVEIILDLEKIENKTQGIIITPPEEKTNAIKSGEIDVTYVDEDGTEKVTTLKVGGVALAESKIQQETFATETSIKLASLNPISFAKKKLAKIATTSTIQSDGSIVIDLGGQIAIKRVRIKVTETGSNKLADIAKVEFLNNMESKIPEPEMDIPENIVATPGSGEFSVKWNKMTNVTGYEVSVTSEGKTEILPTNSNNITVNQFGGKKIKNGTKFIVKVQSVNGEWKSGYSGEQEVIPEPNERPDPPENVSIKEGFRFLKISWKNMENTDSYTLYYKKQGDTEYKSIEQIKTNNYILEGLEDLTQYEIYLTGTNKIGTSNKSKVYTGTTIDIAPPITSNYKLLNTPNGTNVTTSHIKDVTYSQGAPADKFDIVDNDYTSSWKVNTWDVGGYNDNSKAPIVEFDDFYEMDRIILVADDTQQYDYFYYRTKYWDEQGKQQSIQGQCSKKTSSNGKIYYEYDFANPIKTNKIQLNLALYLAYGDGTISISEIKFYHYDTIQKDITELYTDQLHVTLREDVTEQTIAELEKRLNTKDDYSDEYHPKKDILQKELDTARQILNDKNIKPAIQIDTTVTKQRDKHLSFSGGLNAAQPLGNVANAGETIVIYVGNPNLKTGIATNLNLIATQYHAESSKWITTALSKLKTGRNEVTIPKIQDIATERGGSLYVEYTGNNPNDIYGVRVSGGQDIPMLDITKTSEVDKKKELVKEYVKELEAYVANIENLHNQKHKGGNAFVNYDYDEQNCIFGATEIVINKMMYSVSAKQILAGLSGTTDEKAEKLYNSLVAMEDMLQLFYQHKGLSDKATNLSKNRLPSSRLNIRYQRMFAGAFMYAGGLHIGIEWGSVSGLSTSVPVKANAEGKYEEGRYFGWGIAHEIGHIINEGAYAIAEVTNNYFSVLAQAKDTNNSVRFQYRNVYDKVTSGTIGKASNVFTQLAMYWQLHLAYDKGGYNYKTFDNYNEQLNNLFFARVDTYARDVSKAPKASENGVALTLDGANTDNKLMRLSVAAAEKNILEFFEDWGLVPDEKTIEYANQFEKETRRIKFVNDEARAYELEGNKGLSANAKVVATIKNQQNDAIVNDTQIKISLGIEKADKDALLGYEIYRNGKSIGFVTADQTEFIDTINVNNRVYTYEVVAVDKLLNATGKVTLDPIKVRHDGSIAKDTFTITTNMTSEEDTKEDEDKNCSTMPTVQAVSKLINKDTTDVYTGKIEGDAEVVVELNEMLSIVGFKVTKANENDKLPDYELQISNDKENWETIKTGAFTFDGKVATVYFDKFEENKDPRVQVYDTTYVKLILKNSTQKEMILSLSEIDVLGKPGDNVEILKENGIGTLKQDYILDAEKGAKIPAGSFIVTGEYSGHPAYNVVKLYDEEGKIINGAQVIFAQEPKEGNLGNITEGTWIYYIEPEELEKLPTKVRAELYRVDDALTMQGERMVSDSLVRDVPKSLPEIQINQGN